MGGGGCVERHRVEAPWASTLPWTLRPLWPEGDLASPVGSWEAGPRGSRGKVGVSGASKKNWPKEGADSHPFPLPVVSKSEIE